MIVFSPRHAVGLPVRLACIVAPLLPFETILETGHDTGKNEKKGWLPWWRRSHDNHYCCRLMKLPLLPWPLLLSLCLILTRYYYHDDDGSIDSLKLYKWWQPVWLRRDGPPQRPARAVAGLGHLPTPRYRIHVAIAPPVIIVT